MKKIFQSFRQLMQVRAMANMPVLASLIISDTLSSVESVAVLGED